MTKKDFFEIKKKYTSYFISSTKRSKSISNLLDSERSTLRIVPLYRVVFFSFILEQRTISIWCTKIK